MTKNFFELERKMPPKALARSDAMAKALLEEVPLHELRVLVST